MRKSTITGLPVRTSIRAGWPVDGKNHNESLVGLPVRTSIRTGARILNHNEVLVG